MAKWLINSGKLTKYKISFLTFMGFMGLILFNFLWLFLGWLIQNFRRCLCNSFDLNILSITLKLLKYILFPLLILLPLIYLLNPYLLILYLLLLIIFQYVHLIFNLINWQLYLPLPNFNFILYLTFINVYFEIIIR